MKKRIRILPVVLSLLLLISCGGIDKSGADANWSDSNAFTDSSAESIASSESSSESGNASSSAAELSETAHPDESSAAETEYQGPPADAFDCRTQFESGMRAAPLYGTGFVFARSGLNLREQPTASSKKLMTIPYGTEIEVTELNVTGTLHYSGVRWLKAKTNGLEGYVLSDYVAVSCSKPGSEMTREEKAALGVLMYYQSRRLLDYYLYEGGIAVTAIDTNYDHLLDGEWQKLSPEGLTVSKLMDDYNRYFSMEFPFRTQQLYKEYDGSLYLEIVEGENLYLQYDELAYLTDETDNRLTFDAMGHWNTEGEFVMYTENGGVSHDQFVLEYTDGVWKTAAYRHL